MWGLGMCSSFLGRRRGEPSTISSEEVPESSIGAASSEASILYFFGISIGITLRMIDICTKITFLFLLNV
jgi:hypothetical protein